MNRLFTFTATAWCLVITPATAAASDYTVTENDKQIRISTPQLQVAVAKQGYVSGVASQSFLDKKTGFRDPGFGLDIADWIMEPPAPCVQCGGATRWEPIGRMTE